MKPKTFNIETNIGRSKYVVCFYDGIKTHSDGSDFFDIAIFKNKRELSAFVSKLVAEGYKES